MFEIAAKHIIVVSICFFCFKTPFVCEILMFTTAPSLLRGDFSRHTANLLEPEKQFYKRLNEQLERYVAPFSSTLLWDDRGFVITDLGGDWREQRGIRKSNENSTYI